MRTTRAVALAATALAGALAVGTPLAAAAPSRAVGVHITGRTALQRVVSPTVLVDRGTVSGSPVGAGRIRLVYHLRPNVGVATTTFTIVNARGSVSGTARSMYSRRTAAITFSGVAQLTGGTGAYRGIRAEPLEFGAIHSATGKREAISFTGRATMPVR